MNFRFYLQTIASKSVQQANRFVLGNSSVDYDTFFGSIIFAFMLTASTKQLHLPLIDCKHEQLKFRFEIWKVLQNLDIKSQIFKYKDQLPLVTQGSLYTLYDHNARPGLANIEYIVDHHDYTQVHAKKYLISKMGSALTHLYYILNPKQIESFGAQSKDIEVVQYCKKFTSFIQNEPFSQPNYYVDQQLILDEIIRYGILLDTFNMDQKQKQRWTIFDKKALEIIQSKKKYSFGYQELQELKFNKQLNKQLNLQQALVKDYKKFDYQGLVIEYSIIYLQPNQFYQHYRQQIQQQLQHKKGDSHIYMLMSVFKDKENKLCREVAFRATNNDQKYIKIIESFLMQLQMEELQPLNDWHWWRDPKATISRKIFDKEFRKFISEYSKQGQL